MQTRADAVGPMSGGFARQTLWSLWSTTYLASASSVGKVERKQLTTAHSRHSCSVTLIKGYPHLATSRALRLLASSASKLGLESASLTLASVLDAFSLAGRLFQDHSQYRSQQALSNADYSKEQYPLWLRFWLWRVMILSLWLHDELC